MAGVLVDAMTAGVELPVASASLDDDGNVSAVFLRQLEHRASLHATVKSCPGGAAAGITAYTGPEHHFDLIVSTRDDSRQVVLRRRAADLSPSR
jgi:hypothetical protein